MTGSAFKAMDVVVAINKENGEEVWRRGGSKSGRVGGKRISKVAILLQSGIDFGIFRSLGPASVLESF